ncbi:hypothetical protein ACTFIZ_004802 [Dictyostelium cf. discoideum]
MDKVFTYNYSLDKILKEHDDFIDPTFIIECPPTPKLEYDIEDNFYHQQTFIIDDQYQQQHIVNDKAILVVDNQLKQLQEIEIVKENEKKEKEINQNQSIKVDEFEFFIRKSFQYLGNNYKNTNKTINSSPSYPLDTSDCLPINKIKKRIYIKRKCTIIAIHKIQSLEFIIKKKKKKNLPSPQKKKLLVEHI